MGPAAVKLNTARYHSSDALEILRTTVEACDTLNSAMNGVVKQNNSHAEALELLHQTTVSTSKAVSDADFNRRLTYSMMKSMG